MPHSQLQSHLQPVPEPSENWPSLAEIPCWRKYALGASSAVLKGAMITSPYCENRCSLCLPFYPDTCFSSARVQWWRRCQSWGRCSYCQHFELGLGFWLWCSLISSSKWYKETRFSLLRWQKPNFLKSPSILIKLVMNIQWFFFSIADQTVFLQTLQFHIVKNMLDVVNSQKCLWNNRPKYIFFGWVSQPFL